MSDVERDPIEDFIDAIAAGDFNQSEKLFDDLVSDKMVDALEAEKISVAGQIFNGEDPLEAEILAQDEDLED
jgi:hypothetical protein